MKKYLLIAFLILIPTITFATSGACSDHGGVNCSAGASYDGSVICNDGFSDSSVQYSDTNECTSKCVVSQADYDNASQEVTAIHQKYGPDLNKYTAELNDPNPPLSSTTQTQIINLRNSFQPIEDSESNLKSSCSTAAYRGMDDSSYEQDQSQSCLNNIQQKIDGFTTQMNGEIASIEYQDQLSYKSAIKDSYTIDYQAENDELAPYEHELSCQILKPEVAVENPVQKTAIVAKTQIASPPIISKITEPTPVVQPVKKNFWQKIGSFIKSIF